MRTPEDFESRMRADAAEMTPPADKLTRVRTAAARMRDLQREASDLDERLKGVRKNILEMQHDTLPQLFIDAGVDRLDLSAEGNQPAFQAVMSDYYRANIRTDWPEEEQQVGYDLLEKRGCGDMIKRTVEIRFGLSENKMFNKVVKYLQSLEVEMTIRQSVPWNTLTAWLKELYQDGEQLGDSELRILGATIGKVVTLKPKKEKM